MIKKWLNVKTISWIIIFVILLFFWIFQGSKKKGMHCDEYFSYMGANSNFQEDGFAFHNLENGSWITPTYFEKKYSIDKNEIFSYYAVWKNQEMDVHPPLYYLILHIVCSFFLEQFSIIPGLLINIVCIAFLLLVIYKTLHILSGNQMMSLAATVAYGTCPGVISTIEFIRMYALLSLLVGITVYLYTAFMYNQIKNRIFLTGIFLVNLLGGLTHYYFLILAVIIFVVYMVSQIKPILDKKQKLQMIATYILANAASAITYLLIWPSCINHILHGYRGEQAFDSAVQLDSFLTNIGKMFEYLDTGLWLNNGKLILASICIIMIGIYLKGYWNKSLGISLGLGINAIVYYLLVAQISPFKTDRYLMPVYPLVATVVFAVLIIFFNYFVRGEKIFIILMLFCALTQINYEPNYLYTTEFEKMEQVTSQEYENGLYIHKECPWYQLAAHSLYFTHIKNMKIIYNMEVSDLINMDERLQTLSSICVFFDSTFSEEDMIEYFGDQLWGGQYTYRYLDSDDDCNIYVFKRNEN